MNNKDLLEKRFYPAIEEMYTKAQTVFPKDELPEGFKFTFENLVKFAPYINGKDGQRQFPLELFYLPMEEYEKIVKKATRGLRWHYVFPYRSEIVYSDEEIEEMKKKIEEYKKEPDKNYWALYNLKEKVTQNDEYKRRNALWHEYYGKLKRIQEKLDSGEIDRKTYKNETKVLYTEYGCIKKSRDVEKLTFEFFDYGPNSSEEFFNVIKSAYSDKDFECKERNRTTSAVRMAHDFVNNIKNNTPTSNGKSY